MTKDKVCTRAFATLSDPDYFPGLWALLNSLYVYHGCELKVFVFSYGLTNAQTERLKLHPLTIEIISCEALPFPPQGAWEAKQQIMAHLIPEARCVLLLDCDLVITSRMDEVFAAAEAGKIVSSADGAGIDFGSLYRIYGESLVGTQQPHMNSGALCFDIHLHWELAGLWSFSSQFGAYSPTRGWPLSLPGHGDQGVFNALCAMLGKQSSFETLPEAEWCDCTRGCTVLIENGDSRWELEVKNSTTGDRQRLVHSSGPKWWTSEGKSHQARFGDKHAIFVHFSELLPSNIHRPEKVPVPSSPRILVGVCSHGKNRQFRDAVRETWMQLPANNVRVVFFSGAGDEDEQDVVTLNCPDDYRSLPVKVQEFFRYALGNLEFDWLFKCDDDTYLVKNRLADLISEDVEIVGDADGTRRWWFSGGAGYLMSKSAVEALANVGIPKSGPEDLIFAKIARVLGLRVKGDSRLRADARIYPMSSNPLITVHKLNPERMREAHCTFRSSLA